MSEKIARLGIERDNDLMYFIKNGDVWATPRKQPGKPKGKPEKVATVGLDLDYSKYLYFLDSDGDVARKARNSGGGGRRSKAKAKTSAKPTKAPRKTREAQLDHEIEECLSTVKKAGFKVTGSKKKRH